MDSEHEALEPSEDLAAAATAADKPRYNVRRRSLPWDRMRFLVLIVVVLFIIFLTKYNAPFTGIADAFREMAGETLPAVLLILLPLELFRQIHYFWSERSERYHTFWSDRLFGGAERQVGKRFSPWTRFRLGRYVRFAVYLAVYGVIVTVFAGDINNPFEAIVRTPQLIQSGLAQIAFFLFYMLLIVGQFGMLFWFLSRGGVNTVLPEEIATRYSNVWGQDHVLDLVRENVGFLEKPDEIEAKGGYIPGGILLWGPPGTGKTLIAEATAGEVGVPFVFVDPGAFINMFFGVGILKVKGLFRKLRKLSLRHGGVVAFFDEADSLGSRGALAGNGNFQPMVDTGAFGHACNGFGYLSAHSQQHVIAGLEDFANTTPDTNRGIIHKIIMGGGAGGGGGGMGTLQALLTELSGLTKPRGISNRVRKLLGMRAKPPPKYRIFVMMASNLPEALDPALLRPGRIDRIYRVGFPSREGRKATFEGYFAKVDHTLTDQQLEDLAVKTPYYSGAKIKDLVNEALILAMRDDREVIEWDDVWKAKVLKELGPPEHTDYIERERHAVAVHEACHAVVAHLTMSHRAIDMATIQRHAGALGMVKPIQMEDRVTQWRTEYEADIMTSLASLAGEKMFFSGDNSSGVSQDLRNATSLASYMQGMFGMGDGITSLANLSLARFGIADPSPDILKAMPEHVESLLQELYERTEALLAEHRDHVLAVAAALEEKKTISGTEIAEIMGSDPGALTRDRDESWTIADPNRAQLAVGNVGMSGPAATEQPAVMEDHDSGNQPT